MSKNVLIVDRQNARRGLLVETITGVGFSLHAQDSYDSSPAALHFYGDPPDLVILSCEEIGNEERVFIRQVLTGDCFLMVLCATLPLKDSRFLLLANPYNLERESPDPDSLIELIEEALLSMYYKSALRESHHLGSGLGLVQLYVDNICEILKGSNIADTSIDEELDKIVNDVRRVLNRSRGLENRAAERVGEVRTQESLIPWNALLEQVRWALPSPPANIKLVFELERNLARVSVTVCQIMDILRNLMENAIEALMDHVGTITFRAFKAVPHVQIEVIDTGPGIPVEHQSKIFNMFFSTKRSSGFGLWEARKFARKNRRTLTFISRLEQGSTFTLRLPMVVEVTDL
jgi:signal transduction histidine kinase